MKTTYTGRVAATVAGCATGLFLALMATASPAAADPVDPAVPAPAPVIVDPALPPAVNVQAAGTDAPPPPAVGVPHLASPDALPPGSTMDPSVMAGESPNVGYFKDLWHAVRNNEISGREALILGAAQRGMNTPYPDQAPGPNVPITPGDPAPVAPPAPISALPAPTP